MIVQCASTPGLRRAPILAPHIWSQEPRRPASADMPASRRLSMRHRQSPGRRESNPARQPFLMQRDPACLLTSKFGGPDHTRTTGLPKAHPCGWRRRADRDLTKKPLRFRTAAFSPYYSRQRPTLPWSFPHSTIGGIRLNFRVRNGNGCGPDPMTTGNSSAHMASGFGLWTLGQRNRRPCAKFKDQKILDSSIFCKRLLFRSTLHAGCISHVCR